MLKKNLSHRSSSLFNGFDRIQGENYLMNALVVSIPSMITCLYDLILSFAFEDDQKSNPTSANGLSLGGYAGYLSVAELFITAFLILHIALKGIKNAKTTHQVLALPETRSTQFYTFDIEEDKKKNDTLVRQRENINLLFLSGLMMVNGGLNTYISYKNINSGTISNVARVSSIIFSTDWTAKSFYDAMRNFLKLRLAQNNINQITAQAESGQLGQRLLLDADNNLSSIEKLLVHLKKQRQIRLMNTLAPFFQGSIEVFFVLGFFKVLPMRKVAQAYFITHAGCIGIGIGSTVKSLSFKKDPNYIDPSTLHLRPDSNELISAIENLSFASGLKTITLKSPIIHSRSVYAHGELLTPDYRYDLVRVLEV